MTTLLKRLSTLVGTPHAEPEVHFHAGPDTLPAACFERDCGSPRLDV